MQHISVPTVKPILQGSVPAKVTFVVNFNDTGIATGVKKCTILADVKNPVLIQVDAEIQIVFNAATTNVVTIGTTSANANELLTTADIDETVTGFYPGPANASAKQVGVLRIVANTDIWVKYTQTGGVATTGKANFILTITPLAPLQ